MNRHFILALSFLITTFSIGQSSTMLNLELTNTSAAHQEIVLKSNVTDLLVGRYSIGLEKGLNESLSFGIEFDYLSRDVFLASYHPWDYEELSTRKKGVIFEPQLRWYPNGRCLKGLYASFAGFFGIAVYEPYSGELNNLDWSSIGASLHIGHQILLGRFILDGYFWWNLGR